LQKQNAANLQSEKYLGAKNYHSNCKDLILEGVEEMNTRWTHWSTTFTAFGKMRRNTAWHRESSTGRATDQ